MCVRLLVVLDQQFFVSPLACVCGCGLRVRRRRGVGDDEWNLQACVVVAIYSHCYICAYKSSSRIIIIQKHLSGKGKRCSM
jgi:hypothetical protein